MVMGLWSMVGAVKRVVGGGFDTKGRDGPQAGMPRADLKGEDGDSNT